MPKGDLFELLADKLGANDPKLQIIKFVQDNLKLPASEITKISKSKKGGINLRVIDQDGPLVEHVRKLSFDDSDFTVTQGADLADGTEAIIHVDTSGGGGGGITTVTLDHDIHTSSPGFTTSGSYSASYGSGPGTEIAADMTEWGSDWHNGDAASGGYLKMYGGSSGGTVTVSLSHAAIINCQIVVPRLYVDGGSGSDFMNVLTQLRIRNSSNSTFGDERDRALNLRDIRTMKCDGTAEAGFMVSSSYPLAAGTYKMQGDIAVGKAAGYSAPGGGTAHWQKLQMSVQWDELTISTS